MSVQYLFSTLHCLHPAQARFQAGTRVEPRFEVYVRHLIAALMQLTVPYTYNVYFCIYTPVTINIDSVSSQPATLTLGFHPQNRKLPPIQPNDAFLNEKSPRRTKSASEIRKMRLLHIAPGTAGRGLQIRFDI